MIERANTTIRDSNFILSAPTCVNKHLASHATSISSKSLGYHVTVHTVHTLTDMTMCTSCVEGMCIAMA